MAGSISLSLSQQFDRNGRPLSGGQFYTFQATTTTPQTVYKDTALTLPHPNPITLDAYGRIPAFYAADGSIRCRLTDKNGVVVFDEANLLVIGPSSGGGGGGGGSIDATTIFATGDPIWVPVSGVRTGWVRMNGRTIGSVTSGASERASADAEALFTHLWTNYTDTFCPVLTGRGATAAADWAANKQITLPDMRARGPFGLDDMGNSAASRLSGATFGSGSSATTPAGNGGEGAHTLTVAESPAHTHTATVTDPGHTHSYTGTVIGSLTQAGSDQKHNGALTTGSSTTGITVENASTGGGGAHNNMPPFVLGTWFIKL